VKFNTLQPHLLSLHPKAGFLEHYEPTGFIAPGYGTFRRNFSPLLEAWLTGKRMDHPTTGAQRCLPMSEDCHWVRCPLQQAG
jgi:hypothetical protein